MPKQKKVERPVTVTTIIEESQHEALRAIAYQKRLPMAKLVRQALEEFLKNQGDRGAAEEQQSR
ncbi:MAG: ribbon-helix-helix domain-containing protein [Candidatus Tectomicrobia bacterium]|nr:ribbon-helix-helix domain-containing protein [Candidatus Tectomicrobia bacterium]